MSTKQKNIKEKTNLDRHLHKRFQKALCLTLLEENLTVNELLNLVNKKLGQPFAKKQQLAAYKAWKTMGLEKSE